MMVFPRLARVLMAGILLSGCNFIRYEQPRVSAIPPEFQKQQQKQKRFLDNMGSGEFYYRIVADYSDAGGDFDLYSSVCDVGTLDISEDKVEGGLFMLLDTKSPNVSSIDTDTKNFIPVSLFSLEPGGECGFHKAEIDLTPWTILLDSNDPVKIRTYSLYESERKYPIEEIVKLTVGAAQIATDVVSGGSTVLMRVATRERFDRAATRMDKEINDKFKDRIFEHDSFATALGRNENNFMHFEVPVSVYDSDNVKIGEAGAVKIRFLIRPSLSRVDKFGVDGSPLMLFASIDDFSRIGPIKNPKYVSNSTSLSDFIIEKRNKVASYNRIGDDLDRNEQISLLCLDVKLELRDFNLSQWDSSWAVWKIFSSNIDYEVSSEGAARKCLSEHKDTLDRAGITFPDRTTLNASNKWFDKRYIQHLNMWRQASDPEYQKEYEVSVVNRLKSTILENVDSIKIQNVDASQMMPTSGIYNLDEAAAEMAKYKIYGQGCHFNLGGDNSSIIPNYMYPGDYFSYSLVRFGRPDGPIARMLTRVTVKEISAGRHRAVVDEISFAFVNTQDADFLKQRRKSHECESGLGGEVVGSTV